MKKSVVVAGAVVAAVLAVLVVVPAVIDWSRYKPEIEARIEDALGRDVDLAGPLSLRLLPSPAVTAHRVRVANLAGAEPPAMADIAALRLRLSLLPLLGGNVVVRSLELERPELHLQRLADGRANWEFATSAKPAAPQSAAPAAPARGGDSGAGVRIERLTVRDGLLTYRSGAGAPLTVSAIDATVSMAGPAGPFAVDGKLGWQGMPVTVVGRVGELAGGRDTPLDLTVSMPATGAQLRVDGTVNADRRLSGHLRLDVATPSRLAASLPGEPLAVEASVAADAAEAALDDLVLTWGPARVAGSVAAAFSGQPRVDVALTASALDLDAWPKSAAAPQGAPPPPPASAASSAPAAGSPEPAPATGGFALPSGVTVIATLGVDAITWRGQTVRAARLEAALDDGILTLTRAAATLPGETALAVEGVVEPRRGQPGFDGEVTLATADLRGLLGWFDVHPRRVPSDRLRHLTAKGKVTATAAEVTVTVPAIVFDTTRGAAEAVLRLGGRKHLTLAASLDALDLDAYRGAADQPEKAAPPAAASAERPAEPAPSAKAASSPLADIDGEVRLAAGRIVVRRIPFEQVRAVATLDHGDIDLRDAAARLPGGSLKAHGAIRGLGGISPRVEAMMVEADAQGPALARLTGSRALERLGTIAVRGQLTGDLTGLQVQSRAEAAGLKVEAAGTAAAMPLPRYDLTLAARADSLAAVARVVAPNSKVRAGAFSLAAKLAGDATAATLTGLDLRAGAARVTGTARADLAASRPQITADLTGNAIVLGAFLGVERTGLLRFAPPAPPHPAAILPAATGNGETPWSREPLDLTALEAVDARVDLAAEALSWHGWRLDNPRTRLVVEKGGAQVERLTGRLLGGDLSASGRLTGGPTPHLAGQWSVAGANLGQAKLGSGAVQVTQGKLGSEARFAASGRSTAELAEHLQGDGRLEVRDGVVSGFDLQAVSARLNNIENVGSLLGLAQAGLSGGVTPFSALTGTFRAERGVVVTRDLKLDARGGGATADSTVDLPAWSTETRINFRLADSSAPPLTLRLEGPIGSPRKIVDVNALQQYLVSRGLGKALKGKDAQSLVEGLLGGRRDKAQGGQPAAPEGEKPSGQKVLRDLLRGLGR
ncbi:MAG: AsmA family protein [Magnetospirillum sp.]|nr:AsmA family protein [Magnetospirillum sp.]